MQLGEAIGQMGHTLVLIPTTGTVAAVRTGFEAHSKQVTALDSGLFANSDHVVIFANDAVVKALAAIGVTDAPGDEHIFLYDAEDIQHAIDGARLAIEDRRRRT